MRTRNNSVFGHFSRSVAYYCFLFSNAGNLPCWLMCTYSFVSSQEYVFSPSIQSASKGTSIERLINVDMTLCRAFVRWSHVVLVTLQRENSDFLKLDHKALGMELFIVLLKTQAQFIQISSSYPGYWFNLQTRFLIWNHHTVNCTLAKDEKYPE